MQRMLPNVSLQDLLCKITMDHHSVDTSLNSPSNLRPPLTNHACKLGEYREMISSMLQTYCLEQSLLQAASDVMHSDLRQISLKKYGLKVSLYIIHSCQLKLTLRNVLESFMQLK